MKGIAYYNSPVGDILIESKDEKIACVSFVDTRKHEQYLTPAIEQCLTELDEYFFHGRKFFSVEILLTGTTFQNRVWTELLNIPYGRTISYMELAVQIGDINSIRAVGVANNQNPIAIIVPCHRVIGKNGELVGYEGGLKRKEWLLMHEGAFSEQLKLF